jgi:hypothetical protein
MTAIWKAIIIIFLLSIIGKCHSLLLFVTESYKENEVVNKWVTLKNALKTCKNYVYVPINKT